VGVTPRKVGIAFTIREKFSWALESLKRLYRHTDTPFTLYVVDSIYPAPVRDDLTRFLADKENVVWIPSDRFLYPNQALNEAVARLKEPYVWLVQNDVLVEPGCGDRMLQAFEELRCDMVAPAVFEIQDGRLRDHHREIDDEIIVQVEDVVVVGYPNEAPREAGRRRVHHFELHSLMMTAEAARRVCPLPVLNTREHYDLAIQAWKLGMSVYLEDRSRATYVLPPIREYDCDYFRFRWDREEARRSYRAIEARWPDVVNLPEVSGYIDWLQRYLGSDQVLRADSPTPELPERLHPA
jgi:hypothetical protein